MEKKNRSKPKSNVDDYTFNSICKKFNKIFY